jgi:hypothetical protein
MQRRRTFLLMGSAVGALAIVGGAGAAFVATDRCRGWIRKILQRSLPDYSVDPEGFARFVDDYNAAKGRALKLRVFAAAENFLDAKPALPSGMASDVAEEERHILTDFLVGSDFFERYPNGPKLITYRGKPDACASPFATF